MPLPHNEEYVLFASHLERGLFPPIHPFLGKLLVFYGIQLHHFTPDSIMHISCYITLCEGYFNIHPHLAGRIAGEGNDGMECGIGRVVPRRPGYPDLGLLGVSAGWERTFLYFLELPKSLGGPSIPAFRVDLLQSRKN